MKVEWIVYAEGYDLTDKTGPTLDEHWKPEDFGPNDMGKVIDLAEKYVTENHNGMVEIRMVPIIQDTPETKSYVDYDLEVLLAHVYWTDSMEGHPEMEWDLSKVR